MAEPWTPERQRARTRIAMKTLRVKRKAAAIKAYGGACACCGETEPAFLCIDHVENNGAQHRREIGEGARKIGSGSIMFRWLEVHNYPPGFQLLCANCNLGKQSGVCPHRRVE